MSSGKVHAAANLVVLGATLYVVAPRLPVDLAVGATVGAIAGLLCTPDLDMEEMTHEEWRMVRWFGWFGYLWSSLWHGYAITHRHRGRSHAPIIGTLGRWSYLTIRLLPLIVLALYQLWPLWLAWFPALLCAFCFNVLQDLVHLALDGWRYHPGR